MRKGVGVALTEKLVRVNRFTGVISILLVALFFVAMLASVLSCGQKEGEDEKIVVATSILPLADFLGNVGGEKIEVIVMVPPGASPHAYEPTTSLMAALSRARMYAKVGSGIEFELAWMDKLLAVNEEMLVIDCSEGIEIHEAAGEHEGEEGHGAMDPHVWMSPPNVQIMVQNICRGLVQIDPDSKDYYEKNRDRYLKELIRLDQDIRDGLSGMDSRTFMVYHPAFGYFAEEYNLTMLTVEVEGKEPTAAGMTISIEQAGKHNVKVIFISPQFNPQSARVIAEAIGGEVVFIDPLAGDYVMNMRQFLTELVQATE